MNTPKSEGTPVHRKGRLPSRDLHFAPFYQSLGLALVVTLALFIFAEVIERLWFVGASSQTLHLLHRSLGIFSSLLVAALVSQMIIKFSPSFLVAESSDESSSQRGPEAEVERLRLYNKWFIAMRWIAVVLSGLLIFISVQLVKWLSHEVWWPLVSIVSALAALNIVYTQLLHRTWILKRLLLCQGYIDLVILTLLLHFSGGIENPLAMMMLFHVIIGGILLPRRQCYWLAGAAGFLFALLAWAEWADLVEHYTLALFPHVAESTGEVFHLAHHTLYVISGTVLHVVILLLTAYFVTTLAERLRKNERQLEAMAGRALAERYLLEQALATTGTGLRVLDDSLQPFWTNAWWTEWFACPSGCKCPACERLNGAQSPASQTLADGEIRYTEITLEPSVRPINVVPRIFRITTAPLREPDVNSGRVVELAQDITVQKESHAQMIRAGKMAAVGELAGRVAHEVNNPIAILGAKARLLISDHREGMSPKVVQELGKIADLSDRVARIAQGLLSYCRTPALSRVRLDLRLPLRKSLAMVESHAHHIGVTIKDQLPESLPAVNANVQELEQVFLNLLLNALDAMPHGGELRVNAAVAQGASTAQSVAVTIQDTGVGMAPDISKRIFEPFFTTKQERGTGLGLSICEGFVRAHHGQIVVESELGRGTTFTMTFPAMVNGKTEALSHG